MPDLPGQLQAVVASLKGLGFAIKSASINHDEDRNGFITGRRLEADFAVVKPFRAAPTDVTVGSLPASLAAGGQTGDKAGDFAPHGDGDARRRSASNPLNATTQEVVEGEALEPEEIGELCAAIEAGLSDAAAPPPPSPHHQPASAMSSGSSNATPLSSGRHHKTPSYNHHHHHHRRTPSWERYFADAAAMDDEPSSQGSEPPLPSNVTVSQIMSTPVVNCDANDDVHHALHLMQRHGVASLLVVDRRARAAAHAAGTTPPAPSIITKRDFITLTAQGLFQTAGVRVRDVCTRRPLAVIPPSSSIDEASRLLKRRNIRRLLVYDAWAADVSLEPTIEELDAEVEVGTAEGPDDRVRVVAGYVGIISDTDIFTAFSAFTGRSEGRRISRDGGSTPSRATSFEADAGVGNAVLSEALRSYLIAPESLALGARIGVGSYGEVHLAKWSDTDVAVKRIWGVAEIVALPPYDGAAAGDPPVPMDAGSNEPNCPEPLSGGGGDGDCNGSAPTELKSAPASRGVFEREVELLASLRHPHVVSFLGASVMSSDVCIVMEYMPRGSLWKLLHYSPKHPRLDARRRLKMASHIAKGMQFLHGRNPPLLHRDLKTANCLVGASYEVKLCDFGLSRTLSATHGNVSGRTKNNVGTAEYTAPEVLRGEAYGTPADVYSFGVCLWELASYQRPYASAGYESPLQVMAAVAYASAALPALGTVSRVSAEGIPDAVVGLCDSCVSREASERPTFASASEVLGEAVEAMRAAAIAAHAKRAA